MKYLSLKLIALYNLLLSPLMGHTCRYTPSCSQYTKQAIIKYGVIKGCYLGFWRILSCNPYGGCGHNSVPEEFSWKPYARATNSAKKHAR